MKEITKSVQEVVTKEKKVYVAFDGKEFNREWECNHYEYNQKLDALLSRTDIIKTNAGTPCVGQLYLTDDENYYWLKPLTTEAVDAIVDVFESNWFDGTAIVVNEWVCVRETCDDEAEAFSERSIKAEIRWQFEKLGYDVTFTPKKGE